MANIVRDLKANSSLILRNDNKSFHWQHGYAVISVSPSSGSGCDPVHRKSTPASSKLPLRTGAPCDARPRRHRIRFEIRPGLRQRCSAAVAKHNSDSSPTLTRGAKTKSPLRGLNSRPAPSAKEDDHSPRHPTRRSRDWLLGVGVSPRETDDENPSRGAAFSPASHLPRKRKIIPLTIRRGGAAIRC